MSRVYELRKVLCMSRADIGKWINRSASYIWSIENGRAPVPVDQICSALHVRREWLENGAGAMFEDGCDSSHMTKKCPSTTRNASRWFKLHRDELD